MMRFKLALAVMFVMVGFGIAQAAETAYPKLAAIDAPFGVVEITDFSIGAIPIYNSENAAPTDAIVFELKSFDEGRIFTTRAQNGLKFYPYQLWQGADVAGEVRFCGVEASARYLLQLEVVGDAGGPWLKVVTHAAMGCPQNIDGIPMYIPYDINVCGGEKIPGALGYDEYFLIEYDPAYMRLKTWEELMRSANLISNYGGLEVYDKPGGILLNAEDFGQTMWLVSDLTGDWVEVESYNGLRGWVQWRAGTGLHPQIHALVPSRYDEFDECVNSN